MILVFIFCIIIIMLILIAFLIFISKIEIEIKNLKMQNLYKNKQTINNNFKIFVSLKIFGKITWLKIKINKNKMNKIKNMMDKNKIKKLENDLDISDLKQIKLIKPRLTYLKFEGKIGFENVILTCYTVAILCSFISIFLPYIVEKGRENKCYYKIQPLYINKNVYEISLNCIFEIKMVHIINMIYYFIKKRRGENHEQRASNRRSYGYSHE